MKPESIRILVVEDDETIREGLIATLESEGYQVLGVAAGNEALRVLDREEIHLVLLDLMIPERNGYEVCREIRKARRTLPVIMLSAKGEEIDKVAGFELGADDYVTKPFGVRELLARIAAALRRREWSGDRAATEQHNANGFAFGSARVDAKRYALITAKGSSPLTPRELTLIRLFRQRPDEVLTRDFLLNEAWGIDYMGTTRTLDQHIAQLRKKVESDPASPRFIITVHGVGYRYRPLEAKV